MTAAITIDRVTRCFGHVVAVDDLSLEVAKGDVFALIGPDGAGKTTLMRLICGALELDGGRLIVDGSDVPADPAAVQAAVGYMPQRFSLYPDLTLAENLRFYGEIFGLPRAELDERGRELLDDFALTPFTSRLAEALSGGMKQKLALACTLIHKPKTILLDEPTAGVDPVSRREFWKILRKINEGGTTIFVSTPYMDEAEHAGSVAFITRGKILTSGTPQELKTRLRGEVIEVECADRSAARRVLHDEPLVTSVEVFGSTLHALVPSAAEAIGALKPRLEASGVRDAVLRTIEPSLEDAFVELLSP